MDEMQQKLDVIDALLANIDEAGIPVPSKMRLLAATAREKHLDGLRSEADAALLELQSLALEEAEAHFELGLAYLKGRGN